jgi:Fe-Mn family superoxide dismutase
VASVAALTAAAVARPARAGDKQQGKPFTPATAPAASVPAGPFAPAPLPYKDTDLAPAISQNTVGFHYGKHTAGYAGRLNELTAGTPFAEKSLADVVKETAGTDRVGIFNNSAQLWNHDFYWQSMRPGGGGAAPAGKVADAVRAAFGDHEGFRKAFVAAATGQFGAGWAWLVLGADGKLAVTKTGNADNPMSAGQGKPLLVIDVWEHAYYLDYQNLRGAYVDAWLDKLLNWDFVAKNLG